MKLVLASNNLGKVKEIQNLIPSPYEIIPQAKFKVPEVAETGLTFVENAILKARNACEYTKLPAIADDSGLEIDALQGEPGIYSARYAGSNADSKANIAKVLTALADVSPEQRIARFQCVMVCLRYAKDPAPIICQGTWEGSILFQEQGQNGFGYDPIFFVPTHDCSAAELAIDVKNKISHRGQALQCLISSMKNSPYCHPCESEDPEKP